MTANYEQTFFTVPSKIMKLDGLTIQLLKFYETIFRFWYNDHSCYLTNDAIKERTGMKSDSTISAAFNFFEKAGVMRRVIKGDKRFIVSVLSTEIDKLEIKETNNYPQPPSLQRDPPPRYSETPPLATARHNNNNINNNNINKSFSQPDQKKINPTPKPVNWKEANQKKHTWATAGKESPLADVTKQSTSYGYQSETPEESQRRFKERMASYGVAV